MPTRALTSCSYPGAAVVLHARGILQKPLADLWANPRLLDGAVLCFSHFRTHAFPQWLSRLLAQR